MIRLSGGPGDGLHLAISARGRPPVRLVYDPEEIAVTSLLKDEEPSGAGAVYERGDRNADGDWLYTHVEAA
nr:hypothetical protein [Mangrovactinospora gilvigrisea]